jgi:hypothetical protein
MRIQLTIVALVFLVAGIWAAVEVVSDFIHGEININLGVLATVVGLGLFAKRDSARKLGRCFSWFYILVALLMGIMVATHKATITWLDHQPTGNQYYFYGFAVAAIIGLFGYWMDWVLRHDRTRTVMKH